LEERIIGFALVRVYLLFLWSFCAVGLHAQFILNQEGQAFGTTPFFNDSLIAAQHIRTIDGFYTYKKGTEAFKPSPDTFRYTFNQKGQLIASMEILQKGAAKDSIFHHYGYFENGQLRLHRYAAYGGAISEHYTYDSLARLVSIALYRDVYDHRKDTLLSSVKMRTETLRYHTDKPQNYTRYNNYQKPYIEVSKGFDDENYLRSITTYYRISQNSENTKFSYNQTGLLANKAAFTDTAQVAFEEWRYRYDQWGNLIEMHRYENGVFLTDYQIVYDYKTGFLGSLIKKDVRTDQLSILRFTNYSYYPKR
jgi:YD repeat-containing protein